MDGQMAAQLPGQRGPAGEIQVKVSEAVKQVQALYSKGHLEAAEKLAFAVLQKKPKQPQTIQVLAAITERRGDSARAIQILQESLTGANTDALALMNLCRALRMQGRLEESRRAGERAVAIGSVPDAVSDLADTYVALGENDLALATFERAVALRPHLPRARLGLAHALLLKGDFHAGWAEYEWRYKLASTQNILPKFKQPQWNGMKLTASRLLIVCEQGFGDCVHFARYLPMVSERVKDVIIGCGIELKALIERAGGSHTVYDRWEQLPEFQYQIVISSLPFVFGTTLETIPASVPYLSAEPQKAEAWRARLDAAAKGRRKVGIVWQGRPTHPNDRWRSVGLGPLTRMLELENVMPVSLQVGHGREQLAQHPLRSRVFDASEDLKTFDDTAALIANLDCVVSIDSAIAHLAGALAKPAMVMLPYAAEWRWLEKRGDTPWYPTLELVRQDATRSWDSVVTRVCERLRGL